MRLWTRTAHLAAAPVRWALRAAERLTSTLATPAEWLMTLFGAGKSTSGVIVNETVAMGVAAVFACVRVSAEDLGTLPLHWYERRGRLREEAPDYYLQALLGEDGQPNPEMHCGEFVETLTGHLQLRGNGFAEIVWSAGGRVMELWPFHPDRVRLFRARNEENPRMPGQLVYEITLPTGQVSEFGGNKDYLPLARMFHLRGVSSDGLVGLSPLELHKESIGLSVALEQHAAGFFGRGAAPGGVLETDRALSDRAYKRLMEYLESKSGLSQHHRTILFEEGVKWKQVGLQNDQAQFIESRKYQRSEIAAIFRIPLHKIQDLERSTNNNIEHQGIEYVVDCIRPLAVRWERGIRRCLMTPEERARYYPKFNIDGLLRGDMQSRYTAYSTGRQWGWLSADDVREKEEMNPLPDGQGQVYLVPVNMQNAAALNGEPTPQPQPKPGTDSSGQSMVEGDPDQRIRAAFLRVLEETFGRLVRKEKAAIVRAAAKVGVEGLRSFDQWAVAFYREHEVDVRAALAPILRALAEALPATATDEQLADLAQAAAAAHCRRALQALTDAVMLAPGTPAAALAGMADRWAATAARQAAEIEVETAVKRLRPQVAATAA